MFYSLLSQLSFSPISLYGRPPFLALQLILLTLREKATFFLYCVPVQFSLFIKGENRKHISRGV